ncbi:hypothetical protein C0J52_17691 [Blattella germanica]|nr:hypothetical protein C0J52_17691 [Blattella germanica]
MKHQETHETSAVLCYMANPVYYFFNYFRTHCVATSGKVIGSILFPSNQLFWMKQLLELTISNFICNKCVS